MYHGSAFLQEVGLVLVSKETKRRTESSQEAKMSAVVEAGERINSVNIEGLVSGFICPADAVVASMGLVLLRLTPFVWHTLIANVYVLPENRHC